LKEPDSILIRRIKNDDRDAFREIYDRYKYRVFSFAGRYLNNKSDIEEAIQEIFVKLWKTRNRIKEDLPLHNYLFTITRNTILHKKQKIVNQKKYMEYARIYYTTQYLHTQEEVEFNELNKILEESISKIPPKRREIFLLNRNEGLTYKEIAEKLNLSIKTVEAHIRLALQDLRKMLEEYL
jgi:RNA polymerase sigma-70 factor (ECF subfamily)